MMRTAVIPGDGIGPEVVNEALPLLQWARDRGRNLEWEILPHGADRFLSTGEALSEPDFRRIRDTFDAILFGAVGDPRIPDHRHAEAILLRLRQDLQLRVNFRPCRPILDAHLPLKGVLAEDIWIEVFRENTEGPYCLQGERKGDRAVDLAIHTREAVEGLLEAAFRRAEARGCTLTLAHKANVLRHGHGLWLEIFTELRRSIPSVRAQALHGDALLCALVQNPRPFGVIAADNYLGDLISDLLAAFQGGMGVAPSASWAPHRPFRCAALFEPVHGSAPTLAGKGTANPMGMILSTALMFRHFGWEDEAALVEAAVTQTLTADQATEDLGGRLGTRAVGQAVRNRLG
jgi:3-isopropylmalate dehydrogenase